MASNVTLNWRPGRGAVVHEVHLGTDSDAVAAGEALVGSVSIPSYDTSGLNLALGQTFYWMIGDVNETGTPRSWNSDVWQFSTPDFIVVDDMESYDDDENRIYYRWIDGIDDISLFSEAPAAASEVIWIEAEATTSITAPLELRSDNPDASGGQYLTVMQGNNSMNAPPAEGVATYTFTVAGGTYRLMARVLVPTADDNSLWLRIPNATTQTTNHSSGWVWWFDAVVGSNWHWDDVRSNNDNGQVVEFTLPAGTHTLEVGYREDGLLIDAFVLTTDVD